MCRVRPHRGRSSSLTRRRGTSVWPQPSHSHGTAHSVLGPRPGAKRRLGTYPLDPAHGTRRNPSAEGDRRQARPPGPCGISGSSCRRSTIPREGSPGRPRRPQDSSLPLTSRARWQLTGPPQHVLVLFRSSRRVPAAARPGRGGHVDTLNVPSGVRVRRGTRGGASLTKRGSPATNRGSDDVAGAGTPSDGEGDASGHGPASDDGPAGGMVGTGGCSLPHGHR
jgi:hypothetical protein